MEKDQNQILKLRKNNKLKKAIAVQFAIAFNIKKKFLNLKI